MQIIRSLLSLTASAAMVLLLAGCVTFGPYPKDMGGPVTHPPVENFSGTPVVQVTFVANADPSAEAAFLNDYIATPINAAYAEEGSVKQAALDTARSNMRGMFAKNVYYAMNLAKYLKVKANGDYVVILNPVTLTYTATAGYKHQPFEENMPPFDVDITFGAYVHPASEPSTTSSVVTTWGETLAPIVSMRVDPAFSPDTAGAIALTTGLDRRAVSDDGKGIHANLIDFINSTKYGAKGLDYSARAKKSGPYESNKYFALDLKSFDLTQEPMDPTVVSAADLTAAGYNTGAYNPYQFYEGYYRILMGALQKTDHKNKMTAADRSYFSAMDSADLDPVLTGKQDEGRRRFLLKAKEVELEFLQDRDANWMQALLEGNNFSKSFNDLRNDEVKARQDYVNAQAQAAAGAMLAILGAVASAKGGMGGNAALFTAGAVAAGAGVLIAVNAISKLGSIDSSFQIAFNSAYSSQKSYVFDVAQGERDEVRAKDYKDFKRILKERYDTRFGGNAPKTS
jgi:hypothetical protein